MGFYKNTSSGLDAAKRDLIPTIAKLYYKSSWWATNPKKYRGVDRYQLEIFPNIKGGVISEYCFILIKKDITINEIDDINKFIELCGYKFRAKIIKGAYILIHKDENVLKEFRKEIKIVSKKYYTNGIS